MTTEWVVGQVLMQKSLKSTRSLIQPVQVVKLVQAEQLEGQA